MQASVKNVTADVARARRALQRLARRLSTVRLAADTGIHQSQVSRLLRGQFHRLSRNVLLLLAYAGTQRRAPAPRRAAAAKAAVIRAALRTWDTTPEGAQALVRLLRSVQDLRRGARAR
jgi:transcriptional regulator with XRE-family HTH domain